MLGPQAGAGVLGWACVGRWAERGRRGARQAGLEAGACAAGKHWREAGRWAHERTHGRAAGLAGARQGRVGRPAGRSCAHLGVPAGLVGC